MHKNSKISRRGAILPLFALMLVGLMGFLALAIDIGIVAVAETQCQNAADNAALAGTRALNGTSSGNTAAAIATAQSAAGINPILSKAVNSSQVAVQLGAYHYDYTAMTFTPQFPPVAPDNYNLTQVTVTPGISSFFSRIFGLTSLNVQAVATAAYRPRDVAVVLDFSGSMNNEADLWNCESYLGNMVNTPNNTDPIFPQWGVYNPGYSPSATLQCTSTDSRVGLCNITVAVSGIPALVGDLFANSRGAAAMPGFSASSATQHDSDRRQLSEPRASTRPRPPLEASPKSPAARTCRTAPTSPSSARDTSTSPGQPFNGYTVGPGYWGNTFFIWPPDPTNDWRKNFFFLPDGVTPVNDDTALWDNGGNWLQPPGNYVINYKAILNWITNLSPNPFPAQLRSGNILYYSSIPTDVPASAYDHTTPNSAISNQDQRFWKEYIDFALGVWRDPTGNVQTPGNSACSYGPDFACGDGTGVRISGPDSSTKYGGVAFVAPTDNPLRPRHRFWFGPMTLIQYLLDTSLSPGTFHDVSMVPAKLGITGATTDIQQNHPNDMVSMIYYARPSYAGEPSGVGTFDNPISSLGRNYTSIINSLWYPPNSGTSDVRPWDANGGLTPRAHGDYDSQHGHQLWSDAGLQPVQRQHRVASVGHGRLWPQRCPAIGDSGDRRFGQCLDKCQRHECRPLPGVFQRRSGQQLFGELDRSQHRCHQRRPADLRSLQRFELRTARFLDHGQTGLDSVHRLRGHLRADHAGVRERGGNRVVASRSQRSATRRFPVRRPIRRTAISGASARLPNDRPCCSKPSRRFWKARCRSRWSNSTWRVSHRCGIPRVRWLGTALHSLAASND